MEREELDRILDKAGAVKLLVIGVDGVLTDAGMYFNDAGDMLRKFNRRDGMGIQLLKSYDVKSAVVSSMRSLIVEHWAETFAVDYLCLGAADKLHEVEKLQIRNGLTLDEIAYVSDDIDEYDILSQVGFGVTVADGMSVNKRHSAYVTKRKGGEGAVREVVELICAARDREGRG